MSKEDDSGYTASIAEWQETRNTVGRFDQTITDLRKYGFSFITGLITADGFLLTYFSKPNPLPLIAEAVIVVTFVLICTLQMFESSYLIYQKSAIWVAKIIERRLNLDLTTSVSVMARKKHTHYFGFVTYPGLIAALIILAWVTTNDVRLLAILLVSGAVAEILMYRNSMQFSTKDLKDWAVSNLEPQPGEIVTITLTNMDEKNPILPDFFKPQSWKMITEEGIDATDKPVIEQPTIDPTNSYTWTWTVPKDAEGKIFRILVPNNETCPEKRNEMHQLRRKIIVKSQPFTPIAALNMRLAKGEIDKLEYENIKRIIKT